MLAGVDGDTALRRAARNLVGAYNCLELARRDGAQFVFLSTSRVYPVDALDAARATRRPRRASSSQPSRRCPGVSAAGHLRGRSRSTAPRTLYGATKLAAELLDRRVRATPSACARSIDRCGVIAGPWQMGKVDQGVFTYWVLGHYFGRDLALHRLRRQRASRCATCSTSTTSSTSIDEQLAATPSAGTA